MAQLFWQYVPTLVAFAIHLAIIVTVFSAIGLLVHNVLRSSSGPTRYAILLGSAAALLVTPCIVYQTHFFSIPVSTDAIDLYSTGAPPSSEADNPGLAFWIEDDAGGSESVEPASASSVFGGALILAWIAGSAYGVGRLFCGLRFMLQIVRATSHAEGMPCELMQRICKEMSMSRIPRLLISKIVPCPITLGVFRPSIIIPKSMLQEISNDGLEAMLIHELAHIRRRDVSAAWLMQLVSIVYWWNPLCHRIVFRISSVAEEICDDFVASRGHGRTLAHLLASQAERVFKARTVLASGLFSEQQSSVEHRVRQLLDKDKIRMTSSKWYLNALVVFSTLVTAIWITGAEYAHAELVFGSPVNLGEDINLNGSKRRPWVSPDGLQIIYSDRRVGESFQSIYEASRSSVNDQFSAGTRIEFPSISGPAHPSLTPDGLNMVFHSGENGGSLFETSKTLSGWSMPTFVDVSHMKPHAQPAYFNNGLSVAFSAAPAEDQNRDIFFASRDFIGGSWSEVIPFSVNTDAVESNPFVTDDGNYLFFTSDRDGGFGQGDIYLSENLGNGQWSTATNLGPNINTAARESASFLSFDGMELYFISDRPGGYGETDLYVARAIPEPSSSAMLFCGALLVMGLATRRRET